MRGGRSTALVALVAVMFGWGVIALFHRRFAAGELYPEFSSFRTDRMGAKLLYDSLAQLPGITVERNLLPLEFLPRDGATVVLLGMNPLRVNWNDGLLLRAADAVATRGNRVVIAMHVDPENRDLKQKDFDEPPEPQGIGARKRPKKGPEAPPLKTMWKVAFHFDRDAKAHRLSFAQAEGWTVREKTDDGILAIERGFGKGSVVLLAESAEFTNESVVELERMREVAETLGPCQRIVFDEQHLGIAESGSVVGMARQFRLTGLAVGLALVAALFIWRNASAFPPPVATSRVDRLAGRTSQAGLLTLLKRHIAPSELAKVCWREWLSTNGRKAPPEIREQAEAIAAGAKGPVEATLQIQALLHSKGRP